MRLLAKTFTLLSVFFVLPVVQAGTSKIDCAFEDFVNRDGKHSAELNMQFLLDTETQKAYTLGNNGSNEVGLIPGQFGQGMSVRFLDVTKMGIVQVTAIDLGTGKAVYSRHTFTVDHFAPSQYHGSCSVS